MKYLPIFTTSNPVLSRWQSFIEEYLIEENPTLSISEIRNLPISQGCWLFVKMRLEGKKTIAPTAAFEDENIAHQAYANEYFFDAIQEYLLTRNIVNFNDTIDSWNYSTSKIRDWVRTTGWRWVTSWIHDGLTNIYKTPKNKDYSVIDWKLPKNAKIAIIGDWGTANDDAKEFLKALLKNGVDCIIHLGDVYYSGTIGEYDNNFINIIRSMTNVPVFGIPGNHEYYSQGEGFYYMIDKINKNIPVQNATQAASYFCLKAEDNSYQFVGLDTGINDGNPLKTYTLPPAPGLKSEDDYKWAIDKIKNFKGKTILLSHHQLFSHIGGLNSDQYGDSCANPHLYEKFAPSFGKIAAWYWGHEHSFALYKEGAFGLNQGRLIGSSSYEQATTDNPYADNYPLVPFSTKNRQLPPNTLYEKDYDAHFYYPHAGAILTLQENNNAKIEYYSYPSWKNNQPPQKPQLTKITEEVITNPTKTPTGIWKSNKKLDDNNFKSDKAPAICLYENTLYTVYTNPNDNNHLWWAKLIYKDNKLQKVTLEKLPSKKYSTQYDKHNDDDTPSSKTNPVLVEFNGTLYLVYTDKGNETLYWCTYDITNNSWIKMGQLLCNGKTLKTSRSPSIVVHLDKIYLFYLENNTTVKSVIYIDNQWISNAITLPNAINNTSFCPAVVSVQENLFMVYADTSNKLSLLRIDRNNVCHDLGFINNGSFENFVTTKRHVSICTNGKFVKILYVTDRKGEKLVGPDSISPIKVDDTKQDYINWATMDLGFYNNQDEFVFYDFDKGEKGIWCGGIPVLCKTDATMQTQDFATYTCNDELSMMVYPGKSNTDIWYSIQNNNEL